jgi:hypothetical protein
MDGTEMTDADLIRYLDGEPHGDIARETRARLDLWRRRTERLSSFLGELDPSEAQTQASAAAVRPLMARRMRSTPAILKIAAAIVLLLGLALVVPPARAWMLERGRTVAEALGLVARPSTPAAPTPAPSAPETAAVRVSFPVSLDTFDIAATPATGQLIVRHNSETLGTAEAVGAPGSSFTVLRGLRIEGGSSTQAIYTITLPAHVIAVRVRGQVYPLVHDAALHLDLARL